MRGAYDGAAFTPESSSSSPANIPGAKTADEGTNADDEDEPESRAEEEDEDDDEDADINDADEVVEGRASRGRRNACPRASSALAWLRAARAAAAAKEFRRGRCPGVASPSWSASSSSSL